MPPRWVERKYPAPPQQQQDDGCERCDDHHRKNHMPVNGERIVADRRWMLYVGIGLVIMLLYFFH